MSQTMLHRTVAMINVPFVGFWSLPVHCRNIRFCNIPPDIAFLWIFVLHKVLLKVN